MVIKMNDSKIYKDFGNRIKEIRQSLGLTQVKFAKIINCTQATLSSYEKGSIIPSLETMIKISKECQISLDWLCGLSDVKDSDNIISFADTMRLLKKILDAIPYIKIIDYNDDSMGLIFSDPPTIEFLKGYLKMCENLKENLIDQEILDLWTEKTFKKYENFLIESY